MALEIQERHAVVQGIPLVQISDRHFWFGWPTLVLHLVHLTLFQVLISCFQWNLNIKLNCLFRVMQNAFEITYFLWISVS